MRLARRFVTMKFAVRTALDPLSLSAAVNQEIRKVDPSLPITNMRSLEQLVSASLATNRFSMTLLGLFAAVGLVLAAVGVCGVMAYLVTQRTREIGIRMALGAQVSSVLKLVIRQGMVLVFAGVVIGLFAALALTRVMENLLFEVKPTDPATFVVVAVLLGAVALFACWLPARRATKVDPIVALRYE